VTILTISRPDSAPIAVLRLFSPFAFFTLHADAGVTAWRGSPWFFIGWQLALCAIAVLAAILRGAEGRVRTRIIRTLAIAGAVAVILLVLAATGGFSHAVTA
jgi:asparagine N-glycosylation enzyme membrane subunit Stt3